MDAYSNDFKKTVLSWSVSLRYQLRCLKLVEFFYVPVRHCKNVSDRSVLLTYQLRRCDDLSAWSTTLKLVTKMGQFLLGTKAVYFSQTYGGSTSLRYQLVRRYNISKTPVSFSYQLRPLCDVLSWSVSFRYQIGWFYLPTNKTSQRRLKQVRLIHVQVATSC